MSDNLEESNPLGAVDRVQSVAGFVERVVQLSDELELPYGNIWFRGVSRRSFGLKPSLAWTGVDDEDSALYDFLIALPGLCSNPPADPWQLYCMMRHAGMPTRLLDWTKSPLTALFFALDYSEESEPEDDGPLVWILNPYQLNKTTCDRETIFVPHLGMGVSDQQVKLGAYLPDCLKRNDDPPEIPSLPLAIEPPYTNVRMHIQQGCFTVHGQHRISLEEITDVGDALRPLFLDAACAETMRAELEQLGFRSEWVYQDLDRVAQRVVRERSTKSPD